MASILYSAFNGAMVTTASPVVITTGTAIKSLMQLSTPASAGIEVVEWGISFDGSAAATPGVCELVSTVAVAATVTAYVAADFTKVSFGPGQRTSILTLGVANSGFTASAEGTVTATRQFDTQLLPPTAPYIKQFPLERGPTAALSEFLRCRVKFGTAINALCYVVWAE